jgi:hypothetical protein
MLRQGFPGDVPELSFNRAAQDSQRQLPAFPSAAPGNLQDARYAAYRKSNDSGTENGHLRAWDIFRLTAGCTDRSREHLPVRCDKS